MSTAEYLTRIAPPPLVEGQQLDQEEFHRRYEAMPPECRAELIDGVVYMASPVSLDHGHATTGPVVWLGQYELHTPGVQTLVGATVIL